LQHSGRRRRSDRRISQHQSDIVHVTISGAGSCNGTYTAARKAANIKKSANGNPIYYTISPVEYCADLHLTDCVASNVPTTASGKTYSFPAYVRYCSSLALATAAAPVTLSGSTIQCVDKYYEPTYIYPRYGLLTRGDIVPTTASYSGRSNRSDCVSAPVCTYAEEMTNFANWHTYYRRRIQAMKTSAGLSFSGLDDRYRVGFILISPSSPVVKCSTVPCASTTEYLPIDVFNSSQKKPVLQHLLRAAARRGTPLRAALARAGRYYAHKTDKINNGMTDDPVQYSCQQNFALLTTDGMWKGSGDGVQLDGNHAGRQSGWQLERSGVLQRRLQDCQSRFRHL
jgi:type IV pilus assembly protein PilY1